MVAAVAAVPGAAVDEGAGLAGGQAGAEPDLVEQLVLRRLVGRLEAVRPRPGGRVVVGELFGDPHWVSPKRLRSRAEAAGLEFERRAGTGLAYFARFRVPAAAT